MKPNPIDRSNDIAPTCGGEPLEQRVASLESMLAHWPTDEEVDQYLIQCDRADKAEQQLAASQSAYDALEAEVVLMRAKQEPAAESCQDIEKRLAESEVDDE